MTELIKRFNSIVREDLNIIDTSTVLIGISGGVDSVVLSHLFRAIGQSIAFAHVNYHLRGEDSNRDEAFVQEIAALWKIPCHVLSSDLSLSKSHIQENARNIRYDLFGKLLVEHDYAYIATGHHLDDQLETFLINLTRGTGIAGLSGISTQLGQIIRPLLLFKKAEIEEFAENHQIDYRKDKSNATNDYLRNRIRNNVIPLLHEENNHLLDNFKITLEKLNDVSRVYCKKLEDIQTHFENRTSELIEISLDYPFTAPLLFELIKTYGFNFAQATSIISHKNDTGQTYLSDNYISLIDRNRLLIKPNQEHIQSVITIDKLALGIKINNVLTLSITQVMNYELTADKNIEYVDGDKIKWPLSIRSWQHGDTFDPIGMDGKQQKVQDFMSNNKMSQFDKKDLRLLIDQESIIWLVGHRLSHRIRITDTTRYILKLEISDIEG